MRRRQYLVYSAVGSLAATTGCLRFAGSAATQSEEIDPTTSSFEFEYRPGRERIGITYADGPAIRAGAVRIETTAGTSVAWPELGSTVEAPDGDIEPGSTAEIGSAVLNWEAPVGPSETIRVVYEVDGSPTTIGQFSPAEGVSGQDRRTDGSEQATASGDADPVLYHAYDGDLTDSVGDVDGVGAATGLEFVESAEGTALSFAGDGAGDDGGYYDIPDDALAASLSPGDSVSVSLWVRPRRLDGWEMILNGDGLTVDLRDGELRVRWYQNGGHVYRRTVRADEYLAIGEWTHIAAVLDAGREVRAYVDGEALTPARLPDGFGFRPETKADVLRLGFHPNADDGAFDSHFNGAVDALRWYRGTLAESTVDALARRR